MAFNDKYIGTFRDTNEALCVVRIQEDNFIGTPIDIMMGGTPCILTTTETKLQEPIQGIGCELGILSVEGDDYSELYLAEPNTYKIIVEIAGEVVFQGFIDNEFYIESFLPAPFEISLTATDGLKRLDIFEPEFLEDENYVSLITVLAECLKLTGLSLDILIKCTLCAENMNIMSSNVKDHSKQSNTLFDKTQVSKRAFDDMDTKEVLETILMPFNCKIYQDGEVWRVDRLDDKFVEANSNKKYIKYDYNGEYVGISSDISNIAVSVGNDPHLTDNFWVNNGQEKQIQQPYSKQTIVGNLNDSDNLLSDLTSLIPLSSVVHNVNNFSINVEKWYVHNILKDITTIIPSGTYIDYFSYTTENSGVKYSDDFNSRYNGLPIALEQGMFSPYDTIFGNNLTSGVEFKRHCSFVNWNKGFESDSLTISMSILFEMTYPTYIALPNFDMSETNGNYRKLAVNTSLNDVVNDDARLPRITIPIAIAIAGDKWLRWEGTDKGYVLGEFDEEKCLIMLEGSTDSPSGVFSMELSKTLENSTSTTFSKDSLIINETLVNYDELFIHFGKPYVTMKTSIQVDSNTIDKDWRFTGGIFVGDVYMVDIYTTINEITEYNNTATGILNDKFFTRSADDLEISLWNPVKSGIDPKQRGLVSSSSGWWNRNKVSNLLKYYGLHIIASNLDETSGLGLWYSLSDLFSNNYSTTDLGNRLPTSLLASYYKTYANRQEVYTGDLRTSKPLTYKDIYRIGETDQDKQFMLQSSTYDILQNISTVKLFELHSYSVIVNT